MISQVTSSIGMGSHVLGTISSSKDTIAEVGFLVNGIRMWFEPDTMMAPVLYPKDLERLKDSIYPPLVTEVGAIVIV